MADEQFRVDSDNEWPNGDFGLIKEFVDHGFAEGDDREEKVTSVSGIQSLARYHFDLDHHALHIDDVDILVTNEERELCAGLHPIKTISHNVIETHGSVRQLPPDHCLTRVSSWNDVVYAIGKSSKIESSIQLKIARKGGQKNAQLELAIPFSVGSRRQIALSMTHKVALAGPGTELLHFGAVQPSDYEQPRKQLSLDWAKKLITLRAVSKKQGFCVWLFNGRDQHSYPARKMSSYDAPLFSWSDHLVVYMPPWSRAQYFGVFAQAVSTSA